MSIDNIDNDTILHLIKCPICLEIFKDPRMLPCQHSFCLSCLERLAEDRWGRCPQCRQLFRVPYNGVASFDVNRTIVQLLETLPKQIEKPLLKAKCAECRKEEFITVCEHCREAMCKPCRIGHFMEMKDEICAQLKLIDTDNDVLLVKEGKLSCFILLYSLFYLFEIPISSFILVESVTKHEKNITKCTQYKENIQKRAAEMIQKIKDEETKLLDEINEFEQTESSLLKEASTRLKQVDTISSFCSTATTALNKYVDFL